MPIRLKSKKARRGKLVASWDPWTQSAAGTFIPAPNRSGRIQGLMYDWTGVVAGTYRSSSNIVGTIASQLEHWTGTLAGLVPRDLTAPSVPTGLTATAVSSSQINLTWAASTDPIIGGQLTTGVASYRVYRGGTLVQTVSAPAVAWSDTGLSPLTTYSYTVAAVDGAGNASAQSSPASATTSTAAAWEISETFDDATLPSPWYDMTSAGGVSAVTVANMPGTSNSACVSSWTAGAGDDPTSGTWYFRALHNEVDELWCSARVWISATMRDGHLFYFKLKNQGGTGGSDDLYESPTSGATLYVQPNTSGGTTGVITIDNRDESGTWVNPSQTQNAAFPIANGAPHDIVIRLVLNTVGQSNGIIQIWVDGSLAINVSNWRFRTLPANNKLNKFIVGAYRQGTLTSAASAYVDNIVLSPSSSSTDTTAPSVVTGLAAGTATGTTVPLTWTAATDNVAVTGYDVQRATDSGFTANLVTFTNATATTGYTVTALSASTTYYFRVRARDAAGNVSASWSASVQKQTGTSSGTTYWLHNLSNGLTSTIPAATHGLYGGGGETLTTVDGRACLQLTSSTQQDDYGIELSTNPINLGSPFNRSMFFRFWLKFGSNFSATGKWKVGRLGNSSPCLTFYWRPDQWELEELNDGFDAYNIVIASNNNPTSDTTLRNWNEFIYELVYPPSSGQMSNTYFRMYRNGSLIGTSPSRQWFTSSANQVSQWGGVCTHYYPQLTSGGGTIYFGDTSVTDYFYSTY